MLAGGAAAGGITQAASGNFVAAVVVAAVVATLLMLGVRPYARRRLLKGDGGRFGVDRIVGSEAVVIEPVDQYGGRVRVQGAEWSARTADPADWYAAGTPLLVVGVDGATAVVRHG
jgi:membrane protein implicated in regulation of membrane protease activity